MRKASPSGLDIAALLFAYRTSKYVYSSILDSAREEYTPKLFSGNKTNPCCLFKVLLLLTADLTLRNYSLSFDKISIYFNTKIHAIQASIFTLAGVKFIPSHHHQ